MADEIDEVLQKLAAQVEAAVHALYRGDVRSETAKVRTGHLVREAAAAVRLHAVPAGGAPARVSSAVVSPATAPSVAGAAVGWAREDGEAVMRCVMAWMPMGSPALALPESKCVASGREMVPSWGERERARAALRTLTHA